MSGIKVEMIKITNRLKRKLGLSHNDVSQGYLPEEAIAEADELIATLCAQCQTSIGGFL